MIQLEDRKLIEFKQACRQFYFELIAWLVIKSEGTDA